MPDTTPTDGAKQGYIDHLETWFEVLEQYSPGEMIKRFSEPELRQYLEEEIKERWAVDLIDKYTLAFVQETLADLVETHGHGLVVGVKNPPGFLRWHLAQSGRKPETRNADRFSNFQRAFEEKMLQAEERGNDERSLF